MMKTGNLVVVIILYYPDVIILDKIRQLSEKVNIVAVDNTPDHTANVEGEHIQYITIGDNIGIAAAQNIAIKWILQTNAEYVLFLDQDSNMSVNDMTKLIAIFQQISLNDVKIGALGPQPIEKDTGEAYKSGLTNRNMGICRVGELINSGMLTTSSVIREVGGMDSSLFIDYVDFEWCWRTSKKGYHLYLTDKVSITHKVGEKTLSYGPVSFIVSSPFRYYYKTRNFLLLCRRSYVPFRWLFKTFIKTLMEPFLILWNPSYNSQRKLMIKYYFKGICDGIKGKASVCLS